MSQLLLNAFAEVPYELRTSENLVLCMRDVMPTAHIDELRAEVPPVMRFLLLQCHSVAALLAAITSPKQAILSPNYVVPELELTMLQACVVYRLPLRYATVLLENGASVRGRARLDQMAPIDMAVHYPDRHELLGEMLKLRPLAATTLEAGNTPLHTAMRALNLQACCMLLDAGAGLDVQDADGFLPLQLAARPGWRQDAARVEFVQKFAAHVRALKSRQAWLRAIHAARRTEKMTNWTAVLVADYRCQATFLPPPPLCPYSEMAELYSSHLMVDSGADATARPTTPISDVRVELVPDTPPDTTTTPTVSDTIESILVGSVCDGCKGDRSIGYLGSDGYSLLCHACYSKQLATSSANKK